jgi:multiple sugar transport system substrate-binding protein
MYQNRYYSVPFLGGAQLLFYRTDLFEDPIISRNYYNEYGNKLRPPRTWKEFNDAAKFFTRAFNSASPVEFGAGCPGTIAEELCPEIYIRVWGHGGSIFDKENRPCCHSEENSAAFKNFVELKNYSPRPIFQTGATDAVRDFYTGKTAMCITFTEFASKIVESINGEIFGKTGFTFVPGRNPIAVGWNLGINPLSKNRETAFKFFRWLYRKDVNYYLTILNGQSASIYPYENNELLKLYPWMGIVNENLKFTRRRLSASRKNPITCPWNNIEAVLYEKTRRMFYGAPVEEELEAMDAELALHL